jgi:linoleoyl-CoA desaturase
LESGTSEVLGASAGLWRVQHNALQHGSTNVPGFDGDIDQQPFARLAPTQPWRRWHRAQHIYMWPLYGFMAIKNLLVSDLVAVLTGRMGGQPLPARTDRKLFGRITAGKLVHLSWAVFVPLLFNPWWGVLVFYLVCSWFVGFLLAITFQLAHCVDAAYFPSGDEARRGDDFVAHQMRTTVNIDCRVPVVGHLFRWLVGGLDHQIEHHLAPKLPHTVYPILARRFRRECERYGLDYRMHTGLWEALSSHARWLRAMGSRPAAMAR